MSEHRHSSEKTSYGMQEVSVLLGSPESACIVRGCGAVEGEEELARGHQRQVHVVTVTGHTL